MASDKTLAEGKVETAEYMAAYSSICYLLQKRTGLRIGQIIHDGIAFRLKAARKNEFISEELYYELMTETTDFKECSSLRWKESTVHRVMGVAYTPLSIKAVELK